MPQISKRAEHIRQLKLKRVILRHHRLLDQNPESDSWIMKLSYIIKLVKKTGSIRHLLLKNSYLKIPKVSRILHVLNWTTLINWKRTKCIRHLYLKTVILRHHRLLDQNPDSDSRIMKLSYIIKLVKNWEY
jgi:hypothetical protein